MKIRVFQSDKGDCLLLTDDNGVTVLADGGLKGSYSKHVAPFLGKMAKARQSIDLAYVSHIDADHIAGILQLMDDTVDWRVFNHHRNAGNSAFKKPKSPEPPQVKAIWHNAFTDQVDDNTGEIEDQLVLHMKMLLVDPALAQQAAHHQNLVTSKRQALLLNQRLSPKQLNIPLNQPAEGKLMFLENSPQSVQLGKFRINIIGPLKDELEQLRKDWNKWLEDSRELIRRLRRQAREDAERLNFTEGEMLALSLKSLAAGLGDRDLVTTPNLASLMLHVEADGKTLLLTGDGHGDDILEGLRKRKFRAADEGLHVDVLKVQHHGSEHNLDEEFCRFVTADHYVFCGNGAHHNPDLRVIKAIAESRIGKAAQDSKSPGVKRPFKFWFNSSSNVTTVSNKSHMKKVEQLVSKLARGSKRRMKYRFLRRGSNFSFTP